MKNYSFDSIDDELEFFKQALHEATSRLEEIKKQLRKGVANLYLIPEWDLDCSED